MSLRTIAVIGASLAGFRGMEALRREGFEGRLVAIGEEDDPPYDRPPLSKQFLKGAWEADKLELRRQGSEDLDVDWRLGQRATRLDPAAKRIELADGSRVDYDGLLIATGSEAIHLPFGRDLAGVHVLRGLEDARRLRAALDETPRVAVIGAGFIGMEVAASCRERGLEVSVVESLESPLVRGIGSHLGEYVASVFRDKGVELRCGVAVQGFTGTDRVEGVTLADGTSIAADVVVVGIGARPATRWLENSGLELANGVVCDATCATSAEDVVAAGDVARWTDSRTGRSIRVEHWTNAVEQSDHAARRLLRGAEAGAYEHVPYVWSDQFELRIQIAGEIGPDDESMTCCGTREEGRFVEIFGREGRLTGAVGMRRPRQLLGFRKLLGQGASWEQAVAEAKSG